MDNEHNQYIVSPNEALGFLLREDVKQKIKESLTNFPIPLRLMVLKMQADVILELMKELQESEDK